MSVNLICFVGVAIRMHALICSVLLSLLWMPHSLEQSVGTRGDAGSAAEASYPDTANGLRDLLDDMRAAAKEGDSARLKILIANTEIPNYRAWFVQTFGTANGTRWAAAYGETRALREAELQNEMMQFARRPGYFSAKEIVPSDMYDTLLTPLDLFSANWSPPDVDGLKRRRTPIGYFFYIRGKFCWNTSVAFGEMH